MGRYQAYPEYKDSGLQWLGKIPSEWQVIYSKAVFSERNEKAQSDDEQLTASQKHGILPQKLFMEMEQQKVVQVLKGHEILKKVEADDFVISMRSFQGGIEYSPYSGSISSAYVPLFSKMKISTSFFKYFFKSAPYIQALQSTTNLVRDGQALRYGNFTQVPLPIFDAAEQQTIANFLDHETAKIDTLIEKQQQLIQLLKEKRQAVISHAVTKGLNPNAPMKDSGVEWLGQVPEHWTLTRFKYEAVLNPRAATIDLSPSMECNFVPMEKLKTDSLLLDETRTVSDVFSGYTCFYDGDVLMAKVTPCFENKNIAIAAELKNGVGFGSTEIFVLRPKLSIDKRFLFYRLQEEEFMNMATSAMTGAGGLKRVPTEVVNNFQFALPPLAEQLKICEYLEEQKERFGALDAFAQLQVELLRERRTALISAAVTGKIDVRNWQAPTN